MLEFAVVADDLTGSLDTGLQFRKIGFTTLVPLRPNISPRSAEVLVINTNSRNLPGESAFLKVYRTSQNLPAKAIYKKIDSTMRGHVGLEALAILDAKKISKAIIVPAIPEQGRQVEKGILYVHGVPLLQTPYARDPFHPLSSSHLPRLLHRETGLSIGLITLKMVRQSPSKLANLIVGQREQIIVVDAKEKVDLETIAAAWHLIPEKVLPCGSVGLAQGIASQIEIRKEIKRRKYRVSISKGPLLIVSASRNPITARQLKKAQEIFNFPIIEPDLLRGFEKRQAKSAKLSLTQKIGEALFSKEGAILTTTFQEHLPGKEKIVSNFLGQVVSLVLQRMKLGGLILTGGDLAMGVCAHLSASVLGIEKEVLPGIPFSLLLDGPYQGLRLVTKAGGFGQEDALWQIVKFLRGNHEE